MAAAGIVILTVAFATDADARRKRPAPPPPPPPPPVVVIPYRPIAPNGASINYQVPPKGPDGLYRSVNRGISPMQTVWNFRSAYNVAALNCSRTEFPAMIDNYRAFLRTHARALTAANRAVDAEWRGKYGARFVAPREKYMTEVYNSFALPMTVTDFCKAVEAVSRDAQPTTPVQLTAFAQRSLPNLQIVFDDFNRRYEQWKIDAAEWDARYAPRAVIVPASMPAPTPTSGPTTQR
jgi:hypothetical protein